jgi:hypothetical protein
MTTAMVYKCCGCHKIYGCYQGEQKICSSCGSCHMVCTETVSGGFCTFCFSLKLFTLALRKSLVFGC